MIHGHLAQTVGKRIVGAQNMLPLLRDAEEDERAIVVALDTKTHRYRGKLWQHKSGTKREEVVLETDTPLLNGGTRQQRKSISTDSLLAVRIESIDGRSDPAAIEIHTAAQARGLETEAIG